MIVIFQRQGGGATKSWSWGCGVQWRGQWRHHPRHHPRHPPHHHYPCHYRPLLNYSTFSTLMTKVGGVVSVLVVIAIIVLAGALVHRYDHHDNDVGSQTNTSCIDTSPRYRLVPRLRARLTNTPYEDIVISDRCQQFSIKQKITSFFLRQNVVTSMSGLAWGEPSQTPTWFFWPSISSATNLKLRFKKVDRSLGHSFVNFVHCATSPLQKQTLSVGFISSYNTPGILLRCQINLDWQPAHSTVGYSSDRSTIIPWLFQSSAC